MDRLASAPASAAELGQALGMSRTAVSRIIQPLERSGRIVRSSATRGARYGLTRAAGNVGASWPLYRIDELGQPEQVATVHAIERDRVFVVGGPERVRGSFQGLPYYLQDARPGGFLGRAIPAAHPDLALPPRVVDWTDNHVLVYLTQRGSENIGNLILGSAALDRYLSGTEGPRLIAQADRAQAYVELAAGAMHGAPPGSSAHGEHPKFAVRITRDGGEGVHALVKFSPARTTPAGVRWADLLVAEHVASVVLSEHGLPAAHSELLEYGEQVFLQSQRFDRVGDAGRRGVTSLFSLDTTLYGQLDSWLAAAARLRASALLGAEDTERLAVLDTFGALIANTDRHFGNVTLFDDYVGAFRLTPVYDMLPMLFAPQDGHIVERAFTPPGPTAATLAAWPRARALAEEYWRRLVEDDRLSEDFRGHSVRALQAIGDLSARTSPRAPASFPA
jgi:hypothetical protein